MKLLHRNRRQVGTDSDEYYAERPLPDEAPEPQPEREEPRLADPGPSDLSKRDYLAILRRERLVKTRRELKDAEAPDLKPATDGTGRRRGR